MKRHSDNAATDYDETQYLLASECNADRLRASVEQIRLRTISAVWVSQKAFTVCEKLTVNVFIRAMPKIRD
ncbi:hypothetical protein NJ69_18765 [Pseudomonas parafulva]|nr:hypothetical protein NJ69_18765 [Pseudomonas parafulva]